MAVKSNLPIPPKLPNQPNNKDVLIVERRLKAVELRKKGLTYVAIANELGVCSKTVSIDIKTCLREMVEMTAIEIDEYRQLECERLDKMIEKIWPQVEAGNLWAVDRVIMIMDRRSKFLGLDKPMQHILAGDKDNPLQVEHTYDVSDDLKARLIKMAKLNQEPNNPAHPSTEEGEILDAEIVEPQQLE